MEMVHLIMLLLIDRFKMTIASSCNCCACEDKNLLIPVGYDKFKTPFEDENKTTLVFINLDIMDIEEIIEERMEYSLQLYVNEYWKDERLNMSFYEKYNRFQIPRDWVSQLWVPDTIFENSKGGWIYTHSVPNVVVQIHSFHYIHRFTRYNMKVTCTMDLHDYPMDTQNCIFIITSLSYNNQQMMLQWLHEREEGNLGITDIQIAELKPMKYYLADVTPVKKVTYWPSGNFTALYANFTFVRHLSSHIMNVYIPSGLVVILAFLTFWLNVRSVPARVALGLTSLLTLSTQASQARTHLPAINYLTALDIWLFACMMMVFSSLLEYATVYHLFNEKTRKRKLYQASTVHTWAANRSDKIVRTIVSGTSVSKSPMTAKESNFPKKDEAPKQEFEEDTQLIDKVSRILFPGIFLIFSLAYWIHFL